VQWNMLLINSLQNAYGEFVTGVSFELTMGFVIVNAKQKSFSLQFEVYVFIYIYYEIIDEVEKRKGI